MTSIYITCEGDTSPALDDALRNATLTLHADQHTDMWHGTLTGHPDRIDDWFSHLPFDDDTATLIAVGDGVMVTTVVVDGETVSTTRSDRDGVEVADYLQ